MTGNPNPVLVSVVILGNPKSCRGQLDAPTFFYKIQGGRRKTRGVPGNFQISR